MTTATVPPIRTVVIEREFRHGPEKVWRALTTPHLLAEWLMANDFAPRPGHEFTFRNTPRPDMEVVIDCKVIAVEPITSLAYSWAAFGLDSVVTFTLTPTHTGTHLRMEQAGFTPDQDHALKGATGAWGRFMQTLTGVLDELKEEE